MRVGVLGTGQVGKALARGFASRGHEVTIGSRDADKARAAAADVAEDVEGGSFADAATFADLAVLATLWSGTESALQMAGAENLAGKVVIDATNPLVFSEGGPPGLALGHTDSGGEQVQRWLPGARVVKAFNIVGNPYMVDPDLPGGPPDMFIAGDDAEAKATVTEILESFGWPSAIDIGGIDGARLLEPMAIAWVRVGVVAGSWDHAFKLLRK
ncbi:MAG: 8-hydroxy-5-deazaflavin:NADPH oxidoreductase [Solirubrobacteraceae bacterium]|nr:8-hydroxy-5-deazaflavin:NADPH oxidoreductase [Solirubrobacteraceae bacterium]